MNVKRAQAPPRRRWRALGTGGANQLTQARQRLQDMEIEARGLSEATRREMGSKVRGDEESAPEGG